jgi:high-affinity iron transporter
MEQVAFIVWRESVEALLVVGILYSWLSNSAGGRRGLPWLWGGVGGGLLLAAALAVVLLGISSWLSDTGQEWFQALMALAACALVVQMVVWMRRHGRGLKRELETGASAQLGRQQWWGLFALVMIAVAREGSETVLSGTGRHRGHAAGRWGRIRPRAADLLAAATWRADHHLAAILQAD